MRRTALLLLLAPAGCFAASSGGGSPDANFNMQMDAEFTDSGAGVDSSVDAAVDSSTKDVTVEATVDGPVEASGPQPVTVLVTNAQGPEQGVSVVFTDVNDMTLPVQTTDAAGTTSTLLAFGGQATVVMGTVAIPYLFTVQGVAAGDVIAVYDPSLDATYNADQVSVDSWPDAAPPNTTQYRLAVGPCATGGNAPPIVDTLGAGCEALGHFPVLLTAWDDYGQTLGYTWQDSIAVPAEAGATAHVNLTSPWSPAIGNFTVTATGYPPGNEGTLVFTMLAGGVATTTSNSDYELQMDGDAGAAQPVIYPIGYADSFQTEANVYTDEYGPEYGAFITSVASRAAAADAGTLVLDYATLLPMFISASVDSTGDAGVALPVVTWSLADAGSVAGANGVVASITWSSGNVSGLWTIVAPPSAASVQAPALPSAVMAWGPAPGAQFTQPPTVAMVQASFYAGYAGLRAQAGTAGLTSVMLTDQAVNYGGYTYGPIAPPLQANGTLQMTAVTTPGD
jgi:hypothetical protein